MGLIQFKTFKFSLYCCYFQDYVIERMKKTSNNPNANVFTSFNLYIMKELEYMYSLVTEIKSTMQVTVAAIYPAQASTMLQPYCVCHVHLKCKIQSREFNVFFRIL